MPLDFVPDRWLGTINPLMNRNFVPFARGSRTCLGTKYVSILFFSLFFSWF